MHARMTMATVKADRFDEALEIITSAFVPDAKQQHGYRGFLVFSNRETNELMGITLWENESDMDHSSGSSGYYAERMAQFGKTVAAPPVTKVWAVEAFDQ